MISYNNKTITIIIINKMEVKNMSLIGKNVGEFKATAYKGGEFVDITNDSIKGKWSVFFFYPADFTFVCPTELGDLADNYAAFKDIGCEIYAVSTDTHFTHKAWHDTSDTIKKVQYPMIGDPTHAISNIFDVLIPDDGLTLRGTFIVNPDGEIVSYEVNALNIGRNSDELLRKVQAAQFVAQHGDQVCPAKWTPGAQTLKPSLDLVGKI